MDDTTTLNLTAGLDRALAWHEGGSVRYLVADLTAEGETAQREVPALNLALAIDISGSMTGDKIDAARRAALAVVEALTARDRLSLVAFDNKAELLLDARPMDEAGRAAAASATPMSGSGGPPTTTRTCCQRFGIAASTPWDTGRPRRCDPCSPTWRSSPLKSGRRASRPLARSVLPSPRCRL